MRDDLILPILTNSPIHISSKGWENELFELGSESQLKATRITSQYKILAQSGGENPDANSPTTVKAPTCELRGHEGKVLPSATQESVERGDLD